MKKKIVSVLLVAAMAVSMFTGCGSKSDSKKSDSKSGEKTLEVWVPPLDDATEKNWGDLLKDWEKENDCKVNLTVIPWDKYEETYTTALNSGEGPDVGYMYNEMFPTYIDAGAVEDMSSYVTDEDKKEYKYLSNGNMMDGQYGWPLVTGVPFVLYYNEDILNALDMSLEEFQSAVAKVMDDNAGSSDAVTGQETEASVDEAVVTDQTVTEDTSASTQKFVVEDGRQTKAAENAPAQDTQSSEVTEDIPEQETVQNRMTSENAAEDSTDQNNSSDTPGRFRFTNETAHTADGAVITPQSHVVQEFANVETVEPLPQSVNTQDVIDQIVESARVILTEDKTSMELQLNPQNLGKIILKVTEQEGAVTAKIMTQNAVVKEALEAQTVELRQNLEQAGVKVDAVEVTVASHEFEKNLEQNAEGEKQQHFSH